MSAADKKPGASSESESDTDKDDAVVEKDDDAPMGFRIKRKDHNDVVHRSKLLKNNSNFIIICGATGAGKSTILLQLLPCFTSHTKHIVVASAKFDDDAHMSIKNYCAHEKIEFDYVHDSDDCNTTLARIVDTKKQKEHCVVIFDDFNINYSSRGEDPLNQIMIKVFALLRSKNCSGIAISQTYYNIPTKVRENCNMRFIFGLDNVHSHRAFIEDIEGKFFDGDNEKEVKRDIKNIYKDVFREPYRFMLVLSHPPPQIRLGWKDIRYPPDMAGHVEGGNLDMKKKRTLNPGIIKKRELFKQAVELGMPKYVWHHVTPQQLEDYIKVAAAKGQKRAGNSAPELDHIIHNIDDPLRQRKYLRYNVSKWKRSKNPSNLENASHLITKLVQGGTMTEGEAQYYIKKNGLEDFIE